jgi:hypothetical protein
LRDLTPELRRLIRHALAGGAPAAWVDELASDITDALLELRELKASHARDVKICKDWDTLHELPRSERVNVVAERNGCSRSKVYLVLGLSKRARQVRR